MSGCPRWTSTARASASSLGARRCMKVARRSSVTSRWMPPPSALTTCKSMLRVGGDPRLWLREYLREKGLASADRVAHELRCICEALYMAGCYDQ
eukprot:5093468-Pyramimonas_sp.AAC.1